jgi:hypothetical protein
MTDSNAHQIPSPEVIASHVEALKAFSSVLREVSADLQKAIDESNRRYYASPTGQHELRFRDTQNSLLQ